MEKGLARFRVSLLCFCCGCFVAVGLERWFVAAGLLRLLWSAEVADSRRRSFPLRGSLPFSGANAACGCLPPQRRRNSNRVLVQCPFRVANASCGCLPPQRRGYSNRVLVQCPVGLPMSPCGCLPPRRCGHSNRVLVLCLFGSQCRLQLSATSAPRALQPRPGPVPRASPEDYFPARCFSQAQAEARVSSIGRSAFQPSSFSARVGSAQMATTSPGRRGANL